MRVQISEITQRLLDPAEWDIRERGTIRLKGKGMMKTYWLNYRKTKMSAGRVQSSSTTSSSTAGGGGQVRLLDAVDLMQRSNGINRICPSDVEQHIGTIDVSSRPSFGALSLSNRNNSDAINDSSYSLFVRDRFKRSCLIL